MPEMRHVCSRRLIEIDIHILYRANVSIVDNICDCVVVVSGYNIVFGLPNHG